MNDPASFLRGKGIKLNTNLGQHFLIDEAILNTIVATANIAADDHILEIGPGIGVLTRELLKKAEKVTAIELDRNLIPLLREFTKMNELTLASRNSRGSEGWSKRTNKLTILQGNALTTPFPNEPYKIVANIPYHITSPLLRHAFLESKTYPTTMTLLIQREVAEKICDTHDHGLLTILIGLFGTPKLIRIVPPEAFLPPPKVDSAVLHIECFKEPKADSRTIEEVFRLTKIAFGKKRKMLSNSLGEIGGGTKKMKHAGIDVKRRPQTLTIEEWVRLGKVREGL